ncbi:MAG: ATP-binding protein, partial [Byssovorax sp.]
MGPERSSNDDRLPGVSDAPPAAVSSERLSLARHVPPDWLDRLLVAFAGLAPGAPLEDRVGQILTVAREILDDVAVGACIPGVGGKQLVIRRVDRPSHAGSPDPSRLFPDLPFERTVAVPGEDGATLHVAGADAERFADQGGPAFFLDRLAQVLAAVIRTHPVEPRSPAVELKRLQDQVIQLERLASLGQMVAGIVHELNNPLTSIIAYSDYLRKKADRSGADPSDLDRFSRINEAAERILRFSRDLTEYSRPRKVVPAPVMIHEVIDRALLFCEHELDKTGVMVERNFGEVPPVRGVAGQLTQVFVNLFTNAAHAMQTEGGLLSITTTIAAGDVVEVTIRDDGHGIEEDNLPKIFDPFFTTKTDRGGTGLGLSIVQRIVSNHGGTIRANGGSPRGTVFRLELPAAAAPESEAP